MTTYCDVSGAEINGLIGEIKYTVRMSKFNGELFLTRPVYLNEPLCLEGMFSVVINSPDTHIGYMVIVGDEYALNTRGFIDSQSEDLGPL
jgi:hypothetical protein